MLLPNLKEINGEERNLFSEDLGQEQRHHSHPRGEQDAQTAMTKRHLMQIPNLHLQTDRQLVIMCPSHPTTNDVPNFSSPPDRGDLYCLCRNFQVAGISFQLQHYPATKLTLTSDIVQQATVLCMSFPVLASKLFGSSTIFSSPESTCPSFCCGWEQNSLCCLE